MLIGCARKLPCGLGAQLCFVEACTRKFALSFTCMQHWASITELLQHPRAAYLHDSAHVPACRAPTALPGAVPAVPVQLNSAPPGHLHSVRGLGWRRSRAAAAPLPGVPIGAVAGHCSGNGAAPATARRPQASLCAQMDEPLSRCCYSCSSRISGQPAAAMGSIFAVITSTSVPTPVALSKETGAHCADRTGKVEDCLTTHCPATFLLCEGCCWLQPACRCWLHFHRLPCGGISRPKTSEIASALPAASAFLLTAPPCACLKGDVALSFLISLSAGRSLLLC